MSSVHSEISKKVNQKVNAIKQFKQLDEQREGIINDLISNYTKDKEIDLTSLNNLTKKINELAVINQLPSRKYVTKEMLQLYVESKR